MPQISKVELKNLWTLKDVWDFLDGEYGDPDRLTAVRVKNLHKFCYSAQAKTDTAKIKELHQVWREVYTDLEKIKAVQNLDNAVAIEGFVCKFLLETRKAYVKFVREIVNKTKKLSEVMNIFMLDQRKEVQWLKHYKETTVSTAADIVTWPPNLSSGNAFSLSLKGDNLLSKSPYC